jgi:hypothetical protein
VLLELPEPALGSGLIALALVVHAFLVDARLSRPEPAMVTLDRLTRLAQRARVSLDGPALALLPVVHLGVGGEAHEARLRVIGTPDADVLRSDVVVVSRGPFGARHGLLVVTRRGSAADDALAASTAFREVSRGSERVARLLPMRRDRIDEALSALLLALAPPAAPSISPASTSSARLRELRGAA